MPPQSHPFVYLLVTLILTSCDSTNYQTFEEFREHNEKQSQEQRTKRALRNEWPYQG